MVNIKHRYTLTEAAEYLRRETMTPEVSVHDIVTLAAEGKLSVCFPYKGQLGLFENGEQSTSDHAEIAKSIFGITLKTVYFNGVLRSLSRPSPDNESTNLQNQTHRTHTLHPVRVVPICVFASDQPIELGEPQNQHWRRVHGSRDLWAGTQLATSVPEAEWMIETEALQRLTDTNAGLADDSRTQPQLGPENKNNATPPKLKELDRRVISSKARRNTLTPTIERAQKQCQAPWDVAEIWAVLCGFAEKKDTPLFGVTEDGIQWLKNGETEILSRNALAERVRRMKPR